MPSKITDTIPVFKDEIDANIAHKVATSRSISYHSPVFSHQLNDSIKETLKAVAKENQYDIDVDGLYCVRSILVSSVWNRNDDVFDKHEMWQARHSAEDKPCNIQHDQTLIVGHITGNTAIDDGGNLIDENIDPSLIPDIFHIVSDSVIYAKFEDEMMQKRADDLIAEIEENKLFVSMECHFKGFDYAIKDEKTNDLVIIERNNATAFLTKCLRCYGGVGEYNGRKVGRFLRGINFSGKGFVYKPANPDSIIFTKEQCQNVGKVSHAQDLNNMFGVYSGQNSNHGEINQMSEELEAKLNQAIAELETAKSEIVRLSAELNAQKEACSSLEALAKERDEKCLQLTAEIENYKNEKIQADRVNILLEGGFEKEDALSKVSSFSILNAEQFTLLANELICAKKTVHEAKAKMTVVEVTPVQVVESVENTENSVLESAVAETVINPVVDVATANIRENFVKMLDNNRKNSKKESK